MELRKTLFQSVNLRRSLAVRGLQNAFRLGFGMPRRSILQQHDRSDLELEDGRRLEIQAPIGSGSASTVYRAIIESSFGLRRHVAAKVFAAIASVIYVLALRRRKGS